MDFSTVMTVLQNNFFANFIVTYVSTSVFDYTFASLKSKFLKRDVSWQVFDCLQKAHFDTCEKQGWEYNPDAFLNSLLFSLKKQNGVFSETTLAADFINAMGHPVDAEAVKCWEHCFLLRLSLKEYEQLREYIKLEALLERRSIPYLQKLYIKRFNQPQVSDGDRYLALADLYMPNEYKIGNNDEVYGDLLELIKSFIEGNVNEWLGQKDITPKRKIEALLIYGYQCTGKSSLISKIISDYYLEGLYLNTSLHVVSFSDRRFRNKGLSIESVCEYLSIGLDQLSNSLLLIDGLDESDYSSSVAVIALEELIYDLRELNCRPIITSRPNFQFADELMSALDISLQPFSAKQAIEWLNKYKTVFESCDITKIEQHIRSLSSEIKGVILIPYIFRTCIAHDIAINQITGVAELYDLLFDGVDAEFFKSPYNSKPRHRVKEWDAFQEKIVKLSIEYFNSPNNMIPMTMLNNGTDRQQFNKISAEFFLYLKDSNNYSFIHDSIPHYFIARFLFDSVLLACDENDFKILASNLNTVLGSDVILPAAVTDYIAYFVRSRQFLNHDILIAFLKAFLTNQLNSNFTIRADLESIQKYYYQRFVSIVRLVFAFISPNIGQFSHFDLFAS